jgi:LysR family tcuABC transcriptional regulator
MQGATETLCMTRITDHQVRRVNFLCGLSDEELSPAALATRVVLADCARTLVRSGVWLGASLSVPSSSLDVEN